MRPYAVALAFFALSQTLSPSAWATVLHVPADYPTIGAATAVAVSGDEVLVAPGTYNERFTLGPAQDGVKIHSESGPAVTIIDGGYEGTVVTMNTVGSATELIGFTITHGGHNPPIFSDLAGGIILVKASARIQGNVITSSGGQGGGIYVQGPSASPAILDNEIANNRATFSGGGIYAKLVATPDIENNFIHDNQGGVEGGGLGFSSSSGFCINNRVIANRAQYGGGLYASGSPSIRNCVFQGNRATSLGGGIRLDNFSGSLVQDCQILGNVSEGAGGAMYVSQAHPEISRNLVQDNESLNGTGGGLYLDQGVDSNVDQNVIVRNHAGKGWGGGIVVYASIVHVTRNTLALNQGDLGGGNLYIGGGSSVQVQRCILAYSQQGIENDVSGGASTVTPTCNNVWGNTTNYVGLPDPTGSNANVSADPLFCDVATLDFHLASSSPSALGNSGPCNLVGALDVGCESPVATQVTTWGGLKARYR